MRLLTTQKSDVAPRARDLLTEELAETTLAEIAAHFSVDENDGEAQQEE